MTDEFQAWRDALASKTPIAYEKGAPCCGFYRRRYSNRAQGVAVHWQPIAIWRPMPGLGLMAKAGDYVINDADKIDELFATCSKNPISEDQYYAVTEGGQQFPDEIPALESERNPTIGDNSQVPPAERMKGDVEELARAAKAFLAEIQNKVETKDQADKLANFKTKLTELKTSSEAQRTEEKRPHLEAGRQVDETWRPIVALAEAAAKDCSGPLAAYLRAEQQRQAAEAEAARKKAKEEADAAEAARVAAIAEAYSTGAPLPEPEPERPAYVAIPAPAKVSVGTRRGVSLRTRTVYTVTDPKAAVNFILDNCNSQPPADLMAAIQTAVNKACKAGTAVPGVKTEEVDCA